MRLVEDTDEMATGATDTFEADLRELESVVQALESGVALEKSIALLKRGMSLAARCDTTLAQAEGVLEELVASDEGELVTRRLDSDDEDDNPFADN